VSLPSALYDHVDRTLAAYERYMNAGTAVVQARYSGLVVAEAIDTEHVEAVHGLAYEALAIAVAFVPAEVRQVHADLARMLLGVVHFVEQFKAAFDELERNEGVHLPEVEASRLEMEYHLRAEALCAAMFNFDRKNLVAEWWRVPRAAAV